MHEAQQIIQFLVTTFMQLGYVRTLIIFHVSISVTTFRIC